LAEADEDLWSEVSLRDQMSDILEARPAAVASGWQSETAPGVPEETAETIDETVFEEISTARRTPLVQPQPPQEAAVASAFTPAPPSQPTPPLSIDQAEIERIVVARMEAVVKQALEPLVSEMARAMIEAIAWEVIPDLAEAMIQAEIDRVRQSTRTD